MEGIELMGQHGREDYEITVGIWPAAILVLVVVTIVLVLVM